VPAPAALWTVLDCCLKSQLAKWRFFAATRSPCPRAWPRPRAPATLAGSSRSSSSWRWYSTSSGSFARDAGSVACALTLCAAAATADAAAAAAAAAAAIGPGLTAHTCWYPTGTAAAPSPPAPSKNTAATLLAGDCSRTCLCVQARALYLAITAVRAAARLSLSAATAATAAAAASLPPWLCLLRGPSSWLLSLLSLL
jgi:hypothetical protein